MILFSKKLLWSYLGAGAAFMLVIALLALPHMASAGVARGTTANISLVCGSQVSVSLVNPNAAPISFRISKKGDHTTWAKLTLAGSNTAHLVRSFAGKSAHITVEAGGRQLADQTLTQGADCTAATATIPAVQPGVSAALLATACGGDAVTALNNGTAIPTKFELSNDPSGAPFQTVTVGAHLVTTTSKTIETISAAHLWVRVNGRVVADASAEATAPCLDTVATGAAAAALPGTPAAAQPGTPGGAQSGTPGAAQQVAGSWGEPSHVDGFDGNSLQTGAGGWLAYNAPNGSPRRSSGDIRVGNDNEVSELQAVGVYNPATGEHVGSGAADSYNQKYGRWEVRARADKGAGFSPTILLWPAQNHWPEGGEIDLLETPKGDRSRGIAVLHNGPSNYFKTTGVYTDISQWHIYSVDWLPDHVTFYVDGNPIWKVTDPRLIPTIDPMHVVIQNDEGCGWVQCPNAATPAETTLHVDWIKVYKAPDSVVEGK